MCLICSELPILIQTSPNKQSQIYVVLKFSVWPRHGWHILGLTQYSRAMVAFCLFEASALMVKKYSLHLVKERASHIMFPRGERPQADYSPKVCLTKGLFSTCLVDTVDILVVVIPSSTFKYSLLCICVLSNSWYIFWWHLVVQHTACMEWLASTMYCLELYIRLCCSS